VLLVILLFVPMIPRTENIIVTKEIPEEYIVNEAYIVNEEVKYSSPSKLLDIPETWIEVSQWKSLYSTEHGWYVAPLYTYICTLEVIRYRDVPKTRLVETYVMGTKRVFVSILSLLIG